MTVQPTRGDDRYGRLDISPREDQRAALPAGFGRRFLMFVDTEEEFDWTAPRRRDAIATTAIAELPAAQQRLATFGIMPTYLVDYPVVSDAASAAIIAGLARDGGATVGAQLHPWVNPPFDEQLSNTNSFAGNLAIELECAKLHMLTEQIERAAGVRPIVYRAGRYGVGANSARLLVEKGYRLDVSVRPLFDYRDEGGPDFTQFPVWPWWVDDERRLLELPLSAAFTGHLRGRGDGLFRATRSAPLLRGVAARANLVQRVALTPEGMPVADVRAAIDALIEQGCTVFSLSFHSPSLRPGHTPYVRDAADLATFWRWWDGVLDHFARAGVTPASAIELIDAANGAAD